MIHRTLKPYGIHDAIVTHNSNNTYLNEFLDQKGLHHNHICFLLLITTVISYMLDAAKDGVTTNSVSFNQLCDNTSVLFAITYFASEFPCILSSRNFDNSAKSKKSWDLFPGTLKVPGQFLQIFPDIHAVNANSFRDIINATNP